MKSYLINHVLCITYFFNIGCNYALDLPPVSDNGNWKAAKKSEQGTNSVVVSILPCNDNNFTSEEL